jgi:hypothetical protein
MNKFVILLVSLLLGSCYDSGYHPSYIISHIPADEAAQEQDSEKKPDGSL